MGSQGLLTKKRSPHGLSGDGCARPSLESTDENDSRKRVKSDMDRKNVDVSAIFPTGVLPEFVFFALYSESVNAKIWRIASRALGQSNPPTLYPEYTGEDGMTYVYRELDFWTSGFFPGSLYLLLERQTKFPRFFSGSLSIHRPMIPHSLQLKHACKWWTANLHANANDKGTHDLGFMIDLWATKAWELGRDHRAYSSLLAAAQSLSSRFDARVQSLRSWDKCVSKRYAYTDPDKDFLVIIDNMMNLNLLFWTARETANRKLHDIAVAHARTTQKNHIRPDHSTVHVVNYDSDTGLPKEKFTNQGYSDDSCWARGQAWGIVGFTQTYNWTLDRSFLSSACDLADLFIANVPEDGIPYWDFTAPATEDSPRDTSAAMIAVYGLLLIHKAVAKVQDSETPERGGCRYLTAAVHILSGAVSNFLNPPVSRFRILQPTTNLHTLHDSVTSRETIQEDTGYVTVDDEGEGNGPGQFQTARASQSTRNLDLNVGHGEEKPQKKNVSADTILGGATINNHEFAPRRWANHGLVYADYYFLLIGNLLAESGLAGNGNGFLY